MKTAAAIAAVLLTVAPVHAAPEPAQRGSGEVKPDVPSASRQAPQESRKQKVLQAVLYKRLTVNFAGTPAREVFDYLRTALGIPLEVHYAGDGAGGGIDPNLAITLEAQDTPVVEVLDKVLEQCSIVDECTWQVRRGALEVGTKDRLSVSTAREIRWYPVDELVFEAPKFTNAIELRLDASYTQNGAWGFLGNW